MSIIHKSIRRSHFALTTLAVIGLTVAGAAAQASVIITAWDFNNNSAGATGSTVTPSPTPSVGSGTASSLGMTNTYGTPGPSQDSSDIFSTNPATDTSSATDQGSSDPNQNGNIFRIRGGMVTGGTQAANGWSSLAPQYTQGAQFLVSTVGYTNVTLSYDWLPTARGVGDLQLQYTTDGTTWNNAGGVLSAVTANGGKGSAWYDNNVFDFSSIVAANNDPTFGVRMVSAFDAANGNTAYVDTAGRTLNNSSGNWRFDEVQISGLAAAPEPSEYATLSLILLGWGTLILRARKRVRAAN